MPPTARLGDPTEHGAPLSPGPGSPNVVIGGKPACRANVDQHSCPQPFHGTGSVSAGAPTVLINNQMACRMGDVVVEHPGPPDPIAAGCPSVLIGTAGGVFDLDAVGSSDNTLEQIRRGEVEAG